MSRNKKRIIKDSGKDYDQMHKERLIEWLKNDNAGLYKKGPSHSYNAIVYVRDPLVAMGLLLHLHTNGYWVNDMYTQPWNIDEMMHLENRVFTLFGSCVGTGGVFTEHGKYLTDAEIKERLDEHIKDLEELVERTPEDEMTYFDKDFKSRPVINCGADVQMFKLMCWWDNDDFHRHLLVNSRNPENPRLEFPASNMNSIEDYHRIHPNGTVIDWYREATIDDIIEYFLDQGNWDHADGFIETVNGEKRAIKFEYTI